MQDHIVLKKGKYLAPVFRTYAFDRLLLGITHYPKPVMTGDWHAHEKPIISFVLYGHNVEYRKGREIDRKAGAVNFYHAYEPHRNIYHHFPAKHISLEIDQTFLNQYHYSLEQIEQAVKHHHDSSFTFIQLMKEALLDEPQSTDNIEMLFLSFLEQSLTAAEIGSFPHWMRTVRDLLHDRWDENISLQDLAASVNVHPTTISKNFRRYFQCTLGEYCRKMKIKHALSLLKSSKYSLTQVAYQCGFADQSHFTRVFKSTTGYLPKDYLKALN